MTSNPAKLAGVLSIIAGIIMIAAGGVTWALVTSQLSAQNITVAADSPMLPGNDVNGPFSAYAQAQVIDTHALSASEGRTYAELGGLISQAEDAGDTALA